MTDTLEVHIDLNGETCLVGLCRYITKRGSQASVFEYNSDWIAAANGFAIDPDNLPLQAGPFPRRSQKSALPGALRDTAPDRWGQQLIKRAFRKAGEQRTLSETDFLLAINDATRIGALRYKRPGERTFDHDIGCYRVPPLIRLPALVNAADAIQTNTETAEDLKLLLNEGSPLGGARPKSVVEDKDGLLAIAKFPKNDDDRSIPHGEVLAMTLARAAGIQAADARLEDVAGRPVSIIKRFDRNGHKRLHFISAMTMLGLTDGDSASYTDITEIIRKHSSAPTDDLHELFRRMVFNVLISNLDDHLRNHGFLYDHNRGWRLSPAYDLNPVPLQEKARELSTWISEEGPDADLNQAIAVAPYFKLDADKASDIIENIAAVVKGWKQTATKIGMSAPDMKIYASAFSNSTSP